MRRALEQIAQGLLTHMHLSHGQASVLLDETSEPGVLRVYIFSEPAAARSFDITRWRGYHVEIVRGAKVVPHRRASG